MAAIECSTCCTHTQWRNEILANQMFLEIEKGELVIILGRQSWKTVLNILVEGGQND